MSMSIELNIVPTAAERARLNVIETILTELIAHNLTIELAKRSLNDLIKIEITHATGRTAAGNDIGGI